MLVMWSCSTQGRASLIIGAEVEGKTESPHA